MRGKGAVKAESEIAAGVLAVVLSIDPTQAIDVDSLQTGGVTRIDASGNADLTSVDAAGRVNGSEIATNNVPRIDATGNASLSDIEAAGKLQTNGATDPGWGAGWSVNILGPTFAIATEIATGNVSVACNLYNDGTDWRLIVDEADVVPRLTVHNVNGYVYIFSDNATVHLAGEVWSAVLDYALAPGGDLSAKSFTGTGFTEGALLRSVSGKITSLGNVTSEASVTPMVLAGGAGSPAIVDSVDANVKAYGFAGSGSPESLQWAIDFDHDYVAGTDVTPHVHWYPNTTGAGDVGFKLYYQWTGAGAVWQPATLIPTVAVAAGGVQWADKRTDFTISGTGKTYNSRLIIRLIRDSADSLDTYAGHAVLAALGCHYTANPGQAG
jgi:hypothetical protein